MVPFDLTRYFLLASYIVPLYIFIVSESHSKILVETGHPVWSNLIGVLPRFLERKKYSLRLQRGIDCLLITSVGFAQYERV